MRIVIIGAYAESLINFRGDLVKALVSQGHDVVAMAAPCGDSFHGRIETLGATYCSYLVQRNGTSPLQDLKTLFSLRKGINEFHPDIVLAYTIKPVIWGGLAFRFSRSNGRFFALITGLGLAFQPGGTKQRLLTGIVTFLYRVALKKAEKVIFQNEENRQVFVDLKIVNHERTTLVNGSGVNLEHFSELPLPEGRVTFLTISRLLGDKGLRELECASLSLRKELASAEVNLLGPDDPSPDGISLAEVQSWCDNGALNYLGSAADVRPHIANCHVYVLPSYHEGMPRTVLEAMAAGRPIITTDVPGCRETVPLTQKGKAQKERGEFVMEGENGFLVQVKNADALALAMKRFIDDPALIRSMGKSSREIAEKKYDVHKVNAVMIEAMGL